MTGDEYLDGLTKKLPGTHTETRLLYVLCDIAAMQKELVELLKLQYTTAVVVKEPLPSEPFKETEIIRKVLTITKK